MPAVVEQTSNHILIENVRAFSYREGRDSLVLAVNAAAGSFRHSIPYAMLKGYSGLAFRLMFHQDWHRYTPDALCGYDHTGVLLSALGVRGFYEDIAVDTPEAVETVRDRIQASLLAGYPVLAMHLMDYEDWGVIAGITSGGQLICQTPHNETESVALHKNWPSRLLWITSEAPTEDHDRLFIESLSIAGHLFRTKRFGTAFLSGKTAYQFWIDSLRDSTAFAQLEERGDQPYDAWVRDLISEDKDNFARDQRYSSLYLERAHVNAWRFESLIDARASAAAYLNHHAGQLSSKAGRRIAQAAHCFTQQVELLVAARQYVVWEWNLPAAPWTAEMREKQAGALAAALALETQAFKEIHIFLSKFA